MPGSSRVVEGETLCPLSASIACNKPPAQNLGKVSTATDICSFLREPFQSQSSLKEISFLFASRSARPIFPIRFPTTSDKRGRGILCICEDKNFQS